MVNRSVYVLFVVGLVIATLTSMVLQLLSIEEGEYKKNQFIVPNLATKDLDRIRIADGVDHLFTFAQVGVLQLFVSPYLCTLFRLQ